MTPSIAVSSSSRATVRLSWTALTALSALLWGCSNTPAWSGEVPAPDYATFESTAYPVLLRDCAFSECHGNESRFFQVWGPGRTRLDPAMRVDEAVTMAEIQRSYERARSMLVALDSNRPPPLLTKPLEEESGGSGHDGVDRFGRNVYQTVLDPGYLALRQWALTSQALPTQTGGSAGPTGNGQPGTAAPGGGTTTTGVAP